MLIVEDLLESVKRRSMAPMSQSTFQDENLLMLLNESAMTEVTPMILSARENFFLVYKRVQIVSGKSRYTVPTRSIGNTIKDIWFIDGSSNRSKTIPRTDVHDIANYTTNGTGPVDLLLFGDELMIFPTPTASTGYLEIWYYRRPNDLTLTSSCAKITGVSSAGGTTTLSVNTDLTSSLTAGSQVDVLSAKSPYLLWAYDVSVVSISASEIQLATSDISDEAGSVEPQVGDYVCPYGYTNIPQYPDEYHPILAQVGAIQLLASLGDLEKQAKAEETLAKMLQNGFKTIVNRIESEVQPVATRGGILDCI